MNTSSPFAAAARRSACVVLALLTATNAAIAQEAAGSAPSFAAAAKEPPNGPRKGSRSEFFTTEGAMVFVQKTAPDALFALSLAVNRDLPPNAQIKVQFENPAVPGEHFEVPAEINARRQVMVQSPRFNAIKNRRSYLSRTLVQDEQGKLISTHDQWIWFDLPADFRAGFAMKITD